MLLCMALVSCEEKNDFLDADGEGRLTMKTVVSTDITTDVRSMDVDELAEKCTIFISSEKGLIRKYNGVGEVPAEIWLKTGEYVAEAWTGDSVSASFDAKFYRGYQPFTIKKGENTEVILTCNIANVVASVKYDKEVADALSDYSMKIEHTKGELLFNGNDDRKGYFMMPNGVHNLNWTLTGKSIDGTVFTKKGVIPNVKSATEYCLNVKYTGNLPDVGGAFINVVVDETEVVVNNNVVIAMAPIISGVDFNINETLTSEAGRVGTRMVYVQAACQLQSLTIACDKFESLGLLSNTIDFFTITDEQRDAILKKGIKQVYKVDESNCEYNSVINFSNIFTNSLPSGEYSIEIVAKDANEKVSSCMLNLVVEAKADVPMIVSETLDLTGVNKVTDDLVAKVDINVPNGVKTFIVDIISEQLSPEVLTEVGLAASFDLANPGDLNEALIELGFPTGENVIGKQYLPFDISQFMPLLAVFPGTHQFRLTVTDTNDQVATTTLTFLVE